MCGTFRGGAAKVCVFASGLLGTVGGSIVSNVLTAGTMTIPAMKKTGFRAVLFRRDRSLRIHRRRAGTAGAATAFVMAQFMNTGYADVALAATIPSILYYVGLFARSTATPPATSSGLPREELPRFWMPSRRAGTTCS